MVRFGLDIFLEKFPSRLRGKRLGVVCHAASISRSYSHILDALFQHPDARLSAVYGPQHGLFGQTQDNMIEWEGGGTHPRYKIPIFSLYGSSRKPTPDMLSNVDALVVDLQDVGARPYTYLWTLKLCMETCEEHGIELWVLDRPNPIAAVSEDGPLLDNSFHSFVGGAPVPLCHRMTIGEIAVLLQGLYYKRTNLNVVWMQEWWRDSLWSETGLPWVLPSPNMPTLDTAIVYPGMVLLEATNVSEGRGTTRPFELFGAPFIEPRELLKRLHTMPLSGCVLREHNFIPTFQKWAGSYCGGLQIHVTAPRVYRPVTTASFILAGIRELWPKKFSFNEPPYEYETEKMPFDILSGDESLRTAIDTGESIAEMGEIWKASYSRVSDLMESAKQYPEARP